MRLVALFLIGLLLGACGLYPAAVQPAFSPTTAAADLTSKTVAFIARDPETEKAHSFCSGVWVSPTTIATAAHCVDGEAFLDYVTRDDVYAPGELHERMTIEGHVALVVAVDEKHDVALLRTFATPNTHGLARLSYDVVRAGSVVRTLGHPIGQWFSFSEGNVAAVRQEDVGLDLVWIQATAPISPGNSGCGLFDDQGRLIGIASRVIPGRGRAQALNFFVHVQYVDALLRSSSGASQLQGPEKAP